MNTLEAWLDAVRKDLQIPEAIDRDLLLDAARDVAHAVARPAAPLTAYLMGVAVGRGTPEREVAQRVATLVQGWEPGPDKDR